MIKELIEQDIEAHERIGHPAIAMRFLLRNGRAYEPAPIDECDRMERGQCFGNAYWHQYWNTSPYVEGVGWHPKLPMLIDHAWNEVDGKAYDVTWPSYPGAEYWGVEFSSDELEEEIERTGYHGMINTVRGYNLDLMYARDPELREIVENIRKAA